ncbi:MAG TPA: hypothetical protein VMD75_06140 [Candidatus Binataceae bacterium]|nr:hypothetical protein [Candidatus Binataceae bacterium]
MAELTPETVMRVAREFYDYPMTAETAAVVAKVAQGMLTDALRLSALGLEGVEPPFSYATLMAEAERLRREPSAT